MSYSKKIWNTGEVINASNLNNIENGIYDLDQAINSPSGSLSEKLDQMVQVSDSQPQDANNKIWVKGNGNGIQVPTYDEFEDLMYDIAEEYSSSDTYNVGDYTIHENNLFRCITAISTAEQWTPAHWAATTVVDELGASKTIAEIYSDGNLYDVGDYVTHDNKLYRCNTAITVAESWTAAHWTEVTIGETFKKLEENGIFVEDITPETKTWGAYLGTHGGVASTSTNFNAYKINVENIEALIVTYSTYGNSKPYWSFFAITPSDTRTDYGSNVALGITGHSYTNEHLIVNEYIPIPKIVKEIIIVNSKEAATTNSFKILKVNYNNCALKKRLNSCPAIPEYSALLTYSKDDYVMNRGILYKCNQDINIEEEWDSTHWDEVSIANEIKQLIKNTKLSNEGSINVDINGYDTVPYTISDANKITKDGAKYKSRQIPISLEYNSITITGNATKATMYTFLTEQLASSLSSGTSIAEYLPDGETGRRAVLSNTTETIVIPNGAKYIIISILTTNNDCSPQSVKFNTKMNQRVSTLENTVDSLKLSHSVDPVTACIIGAAIEEGAIYDASLSSVTTDTENAYLTKALQNNGVTVTNLSKAGMGYLQASTTGSVTGKALVNNTNFTSYNSVYVALGCDDWINGQALGSTSDASSADTVCGALKYILDKIYTSNPSTKVFVLTPILCGALGTSSSQWGWNQNNSATTPYSLKDLHDAIVEICEDAFVECWDNSTAGIVNIQNLTTVLPDNTHPTEEVMAQMAKAMTGRITFK